MSNFIVARGLGGFLTSTDGYGAVTPNTVDGAVYRMEGGGLSILVKKFDTGVMVYFDDGDNYANRYFELTAEQLAGTDWMIVRVGRSGSNLLISVGNAAAQTIPLSVAKSYSGKTIFMRGKVGGLFDPHVLPTSISDKAVKYYIADMTENSGNALLP